MNVTQLTPIVSTAELEPVKEFYQRHFGFAVTFEGAGYLGLRSPGGNAELAFMRPNCEGEKAFSGEGLTVALEVADVDAEHERLCAAGVTIVQPPRDNPWGDRSSIVRDPVGVWLYICQRIPISPEFQPYAKD